MSSVLEISLSCCEDLYCRAETSSSASRTPRKCNAIKVLISSREMRSFSIQFVKHWPAAELNWEVNCCRSLRWQESFRSHDGLRWKSQRIIWRRTRKMWLKAFWGFFPKGFLGVFRFLTLHFDLDLCTYNVFYMTWYPIYSKVLMHQFQY